jgi:hypothetical protein
MGLVIEIFPLVDLQVPQPQTEKAEEKDDQKMQEKGIPRHSLQFVAFNPGHEKPP